MNSEQQHDFRWLVLVALYGVAALWGIVQVLTTNGLVYLLGGLLFASLAAGWMVLDARRRGNPLLWVVQMIIFFTWYIAVPVYLISSRGWRGLGYALIHALALFATVGAFFYATLYFLYGASGFMAAP